MFRLIMIIIGFILIIVNFKSISKESKSFNAILEKEKVNENRDYDKEIILIRKDLAETVMDLQIEIEEIKKNINEIKEVNDNYINDEKNEIIKEENKNNELESYEYIEESVISKINFSNKESKSENRKIENIENHNDNKLSKVKKLIEIGLSDDEICNELSIGKGEVLLIKNLLK